MHELYELKEMLMNELKEYGRKGEMSSGTLEVVDKLAHAIKSLCVIIDSADGEYSGDGETHRSYARGRGRNARRDSMGRYSRNSYEYSQAMDDMTQELRELMEDAPDERTKQEFKKFIQKIEQM
jgi:hypothetical protein